MIVSDEESLYPEIYTEKLRNEKIELVPYNRLSGATSFETKVSPNPFNESTTLEITIPVGEEFTVALYNIKGQELFSRKYVSYTSRADVQIGGDVITAPGIYYFKVKSSIGELTGKFIRQ